MVKKFLLGILLAVAVVGASPKPTPIPANGITTAAITLGMNFKTIGVYAPFSGDDNGDATAVVEWKKHADSVWNPAYEPYIDRRTNVSGGTRRPNEARTVIWVPDADTSYDVRITWTDPDGVTGTNPQSDTQSTVTYTPTLGGTTRHATTSDITSQITATNAGDTLILDAGTYTNFNWNRSGTSGAYTKLQCDSGAVLTSSTNTYVITWTANFSIIEDCTFGSTFGGAINISGARHDVYIQNNNFTDLVNGCATTGTGAGVNIGTANTHNIYILNNILTGSTALQSASPNCTLVPLTNSPGAGVALAANPHQNVVIEGNSFSGYFLDAIAQSSPVESLDLDINNNTFAPGAAKDDQIDTKGDATNERYWENIHVLDLNVGQTCIAIETTTAGSPRYTGPAFIVRNTCDIKSGAKAGQTVFKLGGPPTYLLHNSVDSHSQTWDNIAQIGGTGNMLKTINNAILGNRNITSGWTTGTIFSYDGVYVTTGGATWFKDFVTGTGDYGSLPLFQAIGQEVGGVLGSTTMFLNTTDFAIDSGSPLYDVGLEIPGINDATSPWPSSGTHPDIGVYEFGSGPAAPVPGNGGTMTISAATSTTLTVNWTAATGTATLTYYGCQSTSPIVSVAACLAATQLFDYTAAITTKDVTGLTPLTTYYFNVIVKDGNSPALTVLYDGVSQAMACGATKVVFTSQPANAVVGASLGTVRVSVENAPGTVCTDSTVSVTIANTGGTCTGMTLGGTKTGNAAAGVFSTPNLTENATGACTLTATSSGLTSDISSSFTISAAPVGATGAGSRIRGRVR